MIDLAAFGLPPGLQAVDPESLVMPGSAKPSTWENLKALYAPAETDEQRDRSESLLAFGAGLLQAPGAAGLGKGFNNFLQTRQYNEQRNFERIMRDELLKVSQLNADAGRMNAETSRYNALNPDITTDKTIAALAHEDLRQASVAEREGNAVLAANLRRRADMRLERNMTDKPGNDGRLRDDKIADYRRLYPGLSEERITAAVDGLASIEVSDQTGIATWKNNITGETVDVPVTSREQPRPRDAPPQSVYEALKTGTGLKSAIRTGGAVVGGVLGIDEWVSAPETIQSRRTIDLAMDRLAQMFSNTRSYEQIKQYRERLTGTAWWRDPEIAMDELIAIDGQVRQLVAQEQDNALRGSGLSEQDRSQARLRARAGRDAIEAMWPYSREFDAFAADPANGYQLLSPADQAELRQIILTTGQIQ